jgi:hypothetical protein
LVSCEPADVIGGGKAEQRLGLRRRDGRIDVEEGVAADGDRPDLDPSSDLLAAVGQREDRALGLDRLSAYEQAFRHPAGNVAPVSITIRLVIDTRCTSTRTVRRSASR